MKRLLLIPAALLLSIFLEFCSQSSVPEKNFEQNSFVKLEIPYGFPYMNLSKDNPLTRDGIALGRKLFFDPMLDKDRSRTCAQCHISDMSFSSGKENSLPLINLVWNYTFLWTGKVDGTLEDIMQFEVDRFFQTDLTRFNNDKSYRKQFRKAFGVKEITSREVAFALAQYVRTFISANSRYDQFLRHEITLTPEEERGRKLYFTEKADCFHCHGTILLTDNDFHNNGLDSLPAPGRAETTGKKNDRGKFKSPTLRNIALTAPYMHDGRFMTLEEVIDFYSEKVNWSPTIDPLMKKVKNRGIRLSAKEKQDLLAFIRTFTDTVFAKKTDFGSPFPAASNVKSISNRNSR